LGEKEVLLLAWKGVGGSDGCAGAAAVGDGVD
jgi:hypothetical protein